MEHFKPLRSGMGALPGRRRCLVAIITGVGGQLHSGADLKKYIPEITKLYKPIIAAVNGPCTAGGMEMLGGVDIRIAAPEAKFAVMEPKRGLFAGGGTTVRLPRQIPCPQAMEFLLCAEPSSRPSALRDGPAQRDRSRDELLDRLRVRPPHHRQRAARGAGHQAERAAGALGMTLTARTRSRAASSRR